MPLPTTHEAIINLMVITSAADRDMTDLELRRIGDVVKTWPIFQDFDSHALLSAAQRCQKSLHEGHLTDVLAEAARAIPVHLHDTAYAAAFEVATVDHEMRLEEVRIMQMLRSTLRIDAAMIDAVERATKVRHRTLT